MNKNANKVQINGTKLVILFMHIKLGLPSIAFDYLLYEPWHEISNNVVCATFKASDQPAHTRSLIRAFASHLIIL